MFGLLFKPLDTPGVQRHLEVLSSPKVSAHLMTVLNKSRHLWAPPDTYMYLFTPLLTILLPTYTYVQLYYIRIIFKLLLNTYKALKGLAPDYLSTLLTVYKPACSLVHQLLKTYLSLNQELQPMVINPSHALA